MRIAIVCSYYPWPPSIGGVETIVRNVSIELAKRGHEVHVVTTPFDVTTQKQVSGYGTEERDGVIIHKLKPGRLRVGYGRFLKGLKETVKEIRPEIVHSHNLHPHLLQLTNWKEELEYRLVAELHYPAVNLDFFIQKTLMPFAVYLLRRKQSKIDAFVAHTNLEKQWLISKGMYEEDIQVVKPPMISSQLFLYDQKALCRKDSAQRLLYVGRVVPKKGLHILLKALSLLRGCNLTIAGPAEEKYLKELRSLTKKLGLENRVEFRGLVTEKEKLSLIHACDIFICPTLGDYHPIVVLEAQALGVPVISTRVGAIPEIVLHKRTGLLVEPNDVVGLADAITVMLKDDEMKETFSKNAKEYVKQFTVESSVEKLEKVYDELLNLS